MSQRISITFEREKATKGAVRFREITDGEPIVGVIYFRKKALEGQGGGRDGDNVQSVTMQFTLSSSARPAPAS